MVFLTRDFHGSCKTISNHSSKIMCLCLRWQRYLTLLLYFSSRNKGLCVVTRWTQNVTLKNTAWENLAWCVQVFITQFLFSCPLYIGQNIRCCNISTWQIICMHSLNIIYFFYSVPEKHFRTRWCILRRWKGNTIFYPFFEIHTHAFV